MLDVLLVAFINCDVSPYLRQPISRFHLSHLLYRARREQNVEGQVSQPNLIVGRVRSGSGWVKEKFGILFFGLNLARPDRQVRFFSLKT